MLFFLQLQGWLQRLPAVGIIVLLLQTLRRDSTDDSIFKVSLVLVLGVLESRVTGFWQILFFSLCGGFLVRS